MSASDSTLPARRTGKNQWLVVVVIVLVSLLVGGIIVANRIRVRSAIHPVIERKVEHLIERLKAQGVSVGEPKLLKGIANVEQAVEIDFDGKPVTLIVFDPAKENQTKELKRIHEEHKSKILGADQAAEDDGSVAIIGFEEHPAKDKVLGAFKD